jgi:uncharacterized protein YqcC (DUF446 family)
MSEVVMSAAVKSLLIALEAELKQQQLWCTQPPDPVALLSTAPFCYDTMVFEQWLQYVFIPRLYALLAANSPLPQKISMLPLAELAFKARAFDAEPLLAIIARLDSTLAGDA